MPLAAPQRWTISRVVGRVHRDVLKPRGFGRRGNVCTLADALIRQVRFNTQPWAAPEQKGIQALLIVMLPGLPDPITPHRRDALWAPLQGVRGIAAYPRPPSADPPPAELHDDIAGPGLNFLCHATDLPEFTAWAQEIYDQGASWGSFNPVFPQGTAPLQAAAFGALLAADLSTAHRLVALVEHHERQRDELRRFRAELESVQSALGHVA
jgi:hypothetical protein